MSDLKTQLIKLGSTNPELQPHIREILKVASTFEAPPKFLKELQAFMLQKYAEHTLAMVNRRISLLQSDQEATSEKHMAQVKRDFQEVMTWVKDPRTREKAKRERQTKFIRVLPTGEGIYLICEELIQDDGFIRFSAGTKFWYQYTDSRGKPKGRLLPNKQGIETQGPFVFTQMRDMLGSAIGKFMVSSNFDRAAFPKSDDIVNLVLLQKRLGKITTKAKEYKTKASQKFTVDVAGWKYITREEEASYNANPFELTVVLNFKEHKNREGQWNAFTKTLSSDMPKDAHTVRQFENNVFQLMGTTRHEAQHVGQDILAEIKGLHEDAGLPKNRSKEYDAGGFNQNGPRQDHALRDVEFHTRLQDEIDLAVESLKYVQKEDRRDMLHLWVGADPKKLDHLLKYTTYNKYLLRVPEFFSKLKKEQHAKWRNAVKDYFSSVSKRIEI